MQIAIGTAFGLVFLGTIIFVATIVKDVAGLFM